MPVSITLVKPKAFEKIVTGKLSYFLEGSSLLPHFRAFGIGGA